MTVRGNDAATEPPPRRDYRGPSGTSRPRLGPISATPPPGARSTTSRSTRYSRGCLGSADAYRDLSKPVGALDAARLAIFRERFESMPAGERFMYGTHYSAPAFVAYFLIRQQPELTLHLHGGKFDEADRLFCSLSHSWASVLRGCTGPVRRSTWRDGCSWPGS